MKVLYGFCHNLNFSLNASLQFPYCLMSADEQEAATAESTEAEATTGNKTQRGGSWYGEISVIYSFGHLLGREKMKHHWPYPSYFHGWNKPHLVNLGRFMYYFRSLWY